MTAGLGVSRLWVAGALLAGPLALGACTDGGREVAEVVATPPATGAADEKTRNSWGGAEIYDEVCDKCHKMGVDGAPELGDVEAWRPRVAKGSEVLFDHVLNGFNKMPARGRCGFCSDAQLRQAMDFMIDNSRGEPRG